MITPEQITDTRKELRGRIRDAIVAWRDAVNVEAWGHFAGRGEHMDSLLNALVEFERAEAFYAWWSKAGWPHNYMPGKGHGIHNSNATPATNLRNQPLNCERSWQ